MERSNDFSNHIMQIEGSRVLKKYDEEKTKWILQQMKIQRKKLASS
jgi:hypothetical protein